MSGLSLAPTALAGIVKVPYKSKNTTISKWEVIDLSFQAKAGDKPFQTKFDAEFVAPSGKKQIVHGFFNGSNEWLIRFSASESGKWNYTTSSEIKVLNNLKGQLTIEPRATNNCKGGIVIPESDNRHFYYENGDPYFLMAFECDWLYALDFHNDQATPRTEHLLDLLSANGFNQIVMNVYTFDINDASYEWNRDEKLKAHPEHEFGGDLSIFPFLGTNEKPDFSTLNVDYFKKLDRTISLMHDKNIVSHLMIYVWNKLVNWPDMYSEADNMYFDYVVKRYGAFPNVMWDVSKEALFYGRADDKYILERATRLRNANSFNRLVSVHDYGFCKRHTEAVDYISRQEWNYQLYQNMLSDYNAFKNKPVFNIEHGGYEESPYVTFEGSYTNAEECLRRNYQCAFSGAYSTHYWQAAAWNVVIWNPFEQEQSFYKPKFNYFKHFTDLFSKYPFNEFQPDPAHNQAGYALKNRNKEQYLFFVPKETYLFRAQFFFDKENPQPVTFKWFNTFTGEYSETTTISQKQNFHSPWYGKADCVLIAEQKEAKSIEQALTKPQKEYKDNVQYEKAVRPTNSSYPLSDQNNEGKWHLLKNFADEFSGNQLDTAKWYPNNPTWKGRPPTYFHGSNVSLENGELIFRINQHGDEKLPEGFTHTAGFIKSKERVLYGYFEARMKLMDAPWVSGFWLTNAGKDWWTEIDICENCPGVEANRHDLNSNIHVFRSPKDQGDVKEHFSRSNKYFIPVELQKDYHVWGLEWDAEFIRFYIDGVLFREAENTHWHQPLEINFNNESNKWFGALPDDSKLNELFRVDYFRVWQK